MMLVFHTEERGVVMQVVVHTEEKGDINTEKRGDMMMMVVVVPTQVLTSRTE